MCWKGLSTSALVSTDVTDVEQITMERASYVADYNQLKLGCNPVVWKTGTYWIDQRHHVRKRSVPFQSTFGINTKVCSLLLVPSTFPLES